MGRSVAMAALAALIASTSVPAIAGEAPRFEDNMVEIEYPDTIADPIIPAGTFYSDHEDEFVEAMSESPNFAGHYILLSWGCGTECVTSAVVDLLTGKFFEGPNIAYGAMYLPESNILIANPQRMEDPPSWLMREYYVMTRNGFELVYEEAPVLK